MSCILNTELVDSHELLFNEIVKFLAAKLLLAICIHALELEHERTTICVRIIHSGFNEAFDLFVTAFEVAEDEKRLNHGQDFSASLI